MGAVLITIVISVARVNFSLLSSINLHPPNHTYTPTHPTQPTPATALSNPKKTSRLSFRAISILDAGNITSGVGIMDKEFQKTQNTHLYWDNIHFYAPVYAGLNKMLLNYICPA